MSIFLVYFLSSQFIWGMLPAFWKLLAGVSPVYLLAMKVLFSFLCCLFWCLAVPALRRDLSAAFRRKKLLLLLLGASLLITANSGLYIYTVNSGHIFESSFASFIHPIVCLVLSAVFFHEPLNHWQKAAAAAAFAGLAAAFLLYGNIPWLALSLCLTFSLYSVLKKEVTLAGPVSVCIESLFMVPAAAAVIFFMESPGLSPAENLLFPATGLITAVPMAFFAAGLQGIHFKAAAILMYGSPTMQFLQAPLFGETLSPILEVNFCFVAAAVALYFTGILKERRPQRKE